jgi:enterochelin esterase-like enzyme
MAPGGAVKVPFLPLDKMKQLIFLFAVGVVALAAILILILLMPASLPKPPQGFDDRREGIEGGKVETVEYDSKAAGYTRKMRVYTPPGSSEKQHYPVLYLLHGSLADETSWVKDGRAAAIFDNLYADKKAVPMIVVMPDCNLPDGTFEADMLGDVIPYTEGHFPVQVGRVYRALAGVSSGAHRALGLGLAHPETFAYLGVFIGGLQNCEQFEQKHQDALKDLGGQMKPKLLWVASGKNDLTYADCQDTLRLFNKYNIHYVYLEGKGPHNWETARNDLFVFAPLVFREMD